MKKKIDLYLENLYLIKNMFEDDPIALPAIEELIEKAEHCKKRSNIELILTAIIIISVSYTHLDVYKRQVLNPEEFYCCLDLKRLPTLPYQLYILQIVDGIVLNLLQ